MDRAREGRLLEIVVMKPVMNLAMTSLVTATVTIASSTVEAKEKEA